MGFTRNAGYSANGSVDVFSRQIVLLQYAPESYLRHSIHAQPSAATRDCAGRDPELERVRNYMGMLQNTLDSNISACGIAATDLQLMRMVLEHNTQAFGILFKRYLMRGIMVAQRVGVDYECSQEIVAESFIKIWNHAELFKPQRGKFSSWFYTIVHNLAVDELRRSRGHPKIQLHMLDEFLIPAAGEEPEDELLRHIDRISVRSALDCLPPAQRQVIELAYLEGMTRREIARVLGLPLGTVQTRARMGMLRLEQILRDREQGKEWSGQAEPADPANAASPA